MRGLLPGLSMPTMGSTYEQLSVDATPLLEEVVDNPVTTAAQLAATSRQLHDEPSAAAHNPERYEPQGAGQNSESFVDTINGQMALYRELCAAGEDAELIEVVRQGLSQTQSELQTMISMVGDDEASLMALLQANEAANNLLAS